MLGNAQMFKQFPPGECVILSIAAAVALLWLMHLTKATNSSNSMIVLDENKS